MANVLLMASKPKELPKELLKDPYHELSHGDSIPVRVWHCYHMVVKIDSQASKLQ